MTELDLSANPLCLAAGSNLSGSNEAVAAHLESLALPACSFAEDRAALVAFYEATGGETWYNQDKWLSNYPIGTWHGVVTDENGRVTELVLEGNGLRGNLPDLSALKNLTVLDLSFNGIGGPIPDMSALANLTELILWGNALSGPVPDFSALTGLTVLVLSGNQLTGPIPDLSSLTSLTVWVSGTTC